MRHQFTPEERRRGGLRSGTKFRRGPDPRRHRFTRDECSRAGRASWARIMAEVRLSMGLPLPSPELREAARRLLAARRLRGTPAA